MEEDKKAKIQILQKHRSLNRRQERIIDEAFKCNEFFDPHDLVQVKYEMLRRVLVEGHPVARAASAFGFSRVAFYQIKAAYEAGGLPALIPRPTGPKYGHKITKQVLGFIDRCLTTDKSLNASTLAKRVQKQFGFSVHPRTIERALSRHQKKGRIIIPG